TTRSPHVGIHAHDWDVALDGDTGVATFTRGDRRFQSLPRGRIHRPPHGQAANGSSGGDGRAPAGDRALPLDGARAPASDRILPRDRTPADGRAPPSDRPPDRADGGRRNSTNGQDPPRAGPDPPIGDHHQSDETERVYYDRNGNQLPF